MYICMHTSRWVARIRRKGQAVINPQVLFGVGTHSIIPIRALSTVAPVGQDCSRDIPCLVHTVCLGRIVFTAVTPLEDGKIILIHVVIAIKFGVRTIRIILGHPRRGGT